MAEYNCSLKHVNANNIEIANKFIEDIKTLIDVPECIIESFNAFDSVDGNMVTCRCNLHYNCTDFEHYEKNKNFFNIFINCGFSVLNNTSVFNTIKYFSLDRYYLSHHYDYDNYVSNKKISMLFYKVKENRIIDFKEFSNMYTSVINSITDDVYFVQDALTDPKDIMDEINTIDEQLKDLHDQEYRLRNERHKLYQKRKILFNKHLKMCTDF